MNNYVVYIAVSPSNTYFNVTRKVATTCVKNGKIKEFNILKINK